jgi:drug/metabolite transporter (DMT)-like permease
MGHVLYYKGVSVVGAGRAAIFMNLIPFLVIGLSWLIPRRARVLVPLSWAPRSDRGWR